MREMGSNNHRKVYQYESPDGERPVECFINSLDRKQQSKIYTLIQIVAYNPDALKPPHVKAFRLEKYKGLYELRAKMVKLIRIIFYLTEEGDIVFLYAFFKKHDRATEQALDTSKIRMAYLRSGYATKIILGGTRE